ncbi:MAG: hypothetical protein OXR66_01140 [Candidatus Woesearchaeota archaeon]|nr:hypothetical protein [Candidatus Woesearchaeota archaeon]
MEIPENLRELENRIEENYREAIRELGRDIDKPYLVLSRQDERRGGPVYNLQREHIIEEHKGDCYGRFSGLGVRGVSDFNDFINDLSRDELAKVYSNLYKRALKISLSQDSKPR